MKELMIALLVACLAGATFASSENEDSRSNTTLTALYALSETLKKSSIGDLKSWIQEWLKKGANEPLCAFVGESDIQNNEIIVSDIRIESEGEMVIIKNMTKLTVRVTHDYGRKIFKEMVEKGESRHDSNDSDLFTECNWTQEVSLNDEGDPLLFRCGICTTKFPRSFFNPKFAKSEVVSSLFWITKTI